MRHMAHRTPDARRNRRTLPHCPRPPGNACNQSLPCLIVGGQPSTNTIMITLLIVDDSPIARQILKKCLPKESTLSIIEAGDGQEALEKFRQYRPEITFMDMTMPVMDGFQAIAEIKQIDPQAIIIAATADVQQKAKQRIAELGALMHLPKPVTPKGVRDALAKAEQALRGQI